MPQVAWKRRGTVSGPNGKTGRVFFLTVSPGAMSAPVAAAEKGSGETWLLMNGAMATLHVHRGDREIEHFPPVSLSRDGASAHRTDDIDGEFRIDWVARKSRFPILLGLDYPTPAHDREAPEAGILSRPGFYDYLTHHRRHGPSLQDTVLEEISGFMSRYCRSVASLMLH